MAKSRRQRASEAKIWRARQKLQEEFRMTESERRIVWRATGLLRTHFDTMVPVSHEVFYGKFPIEVYDLRQRPTTVYEAKSPSHLLRLAQRIVSKAGTERITPEERKAAADLAKEYSRWQAKITVERYKGPYPNGKDRRPYKLDVKIGEKREQKHFKRLVDVQVHLKKHCVDYDTEFDPAFIDKLNIWLKLHFNKDITVWADKFGRPPIYTLRDRRKNGSSKSGSSRLFYTATELETAVQKLVKAAKLVSEELIYRHEYDIVKQLQKDYDAEFITVGRFKGYTASGTQRRPFTVSFELSGKRVKRAFPDVESMKEFVETNLHPVAEESF